MMIPSKILTVFVTCGLVLACLNLRPNDIDKPSPNGLYRVKVKVSPAHISGQLDKAEFQFFRGTEIIDTWNWGQEDQFGPDFAALMPSIEWVAGNVLRMGAKQPPEGFHDELIISNSSDENFTYVSISYGRYESFRIFDLNSGSQILIKATPRFDSTGSFNRVVGVSGKTATGRTFANVMEGKERLSPADGPIKFSIDIGSKDLK
jgi:hypothetical protein